MISAGCWSTGKTSCGADEVALLLLLTCHTNEQSACCSPGTIRHLLQVVMQDLKGLLLDLMMQVEPSIMHIV